MACSPSLGEVLTWKFEREIKKIILIITTMWKSRVAGDRLARMSTKVECWLKFAVLKTLKCIRDWSNVIQNRKRQSDERSRVPSAIFIYDSTARFDRRFFRWMWTENKWIRRTATIDNDNNNSSRVIKFEMRLTNATLLMLVNSYQQQQLRGNLWTVLFIDKCGKLRLNKSAWKVPISLISTTGKKIEHSFWVIDFAEHDYNCW